IPTSALTPPEGGGHGLLAEYFDNPELSGEPKLRRVEPRPFVQPGITDPAIGFTYSVRWTGTLHPPVSGEYTIAPRAPGRTPVIHLFFDDKEVGPAPARITLDAAHSYRLRLEFRSQGPQSSASLAWIPPADPLLADAIDAVKNSDIAIACLGLNP